MRQWITLCNIQLVILFVGVWMTSRKRRVPSLAFVCNQQVMTWLALKVINSPQSKVLRSLGETHTSCLSVVLLINLSWPKINNKTSIYTLSTRAELEIPTGSKCNWWTREQFAYEMSTLLKYYSICLNGDKYSFALMSRCNAHISRLFFVRIRISKWEVISIGDDRWS